ncbi:hypothetical protein E5Q_05523 [Mixia osmundae IAM 14324]|uniref:5'-3' exoribonuclease 1 n=1 Tax=Mixia osmundae (strain CBS 9802 / IAM 14324 / JCM 22182 / KY 12970) TaxID=764103 RepID=G7E7M5_MIXOS|nr:hypothetical protein E5Q_05523 [Mixia osmundae IAM 14324]
MGVPKFFRWVSERYPMISQLIQEGQQPEFDNLYLDMNGIIHNCSHKDGGDVHHRVTEEQMFLAIFTYIELLFSKIRPKQTFFMAIDGVAPRAKMNQQRSRRFRTAKEAKEARDAAIRKGEELPKEDPFDSNAITPGTPFMTRLSAQLRYFVNKKVSEDADWQGIQVILSGHEVPGEGEHKIMQFIRHSKAQPGYNPNVRHCLYGLDADLIMLGLLSHDPHFCLLREEVVFGKARKTSQSLETKNFYLLHLSLFREYLDLEFQSLAADPTLGFQYDLERIIDDFILLAIFVGNDFLPHLPGLHINEGALTLLFEIYKRVLPKAGGYINEHGQLNTHRLSLILEELQSFESDNFEKEYADSNWFKGKQQNYIEAMEQARARSKLVLTKEQRTLFRKVKTWLLSHLDAPTSDAVMTLPAKYPARDRRFLSDLANELRLFITFDEFDEDDKPVIALRFDEEMLSLAAADGSVSSKLAATHLDDDADDPAWQDEEASSSPHEDDEWKEAISRILAKYDKAQTLPDFNEADFEDSYAQKLEQKMSAWKTDYYRDKLEFEFTDKPALHQLAFRYIEGLQWVLHYYYDGVASWGWFYDYHYAPKISDLQNVDHMEFVFDLGRPFKPFEQLMGVLPDLSATILPEAYRDLLTSPESPIKDFYPRDFKLDLNGKKQDWEAVVKIPFIDQARLLHAMEGRSARLTPDEQQRNTWGDSYIFTYDAAHFATYPSSLPGFFPDLQNCQTKMLPYHLPTVEHLDFVKGLCEGALIGKDAVAGFPSLHTVQFTAQLGYHSVNVFQFDSKNESIVVTLDDAIEDGKPEEIAQQLIGQRIYVGWPYLREALVVAISNDLFRYEASPVAPGRIDSIPHRPELIRGWRKAADRIEETYSKRFGVIIGGVETLVHVKLLKGLKRLDDGALIKEWEVNENEQALQTIVQDVSSVDARYLEQAAAPINVDFPENTNIFFLGVGEYGAPAKVVGHEGNTAAIQTFTCALDAKEREIFRSLYQSLPQANYLPSPAVSRRLKMSALTLSKLTSSLLLAYKEQKINAGLNLKFEAKAQKVLGYTRRNDFGWEYSSRALKLLTSYKAKFPEIVQALDGNKHDIQSLSDIYPAQMLEAKAKEIKAWTTEHTQDFERVPLNADQLEKAQVQILEAKADELQNLRSQTEFKRKVFRGLPRSSLLRPSHTGTRLQKQTFTTGDRIIFVSDIGHVPLAAKGTVVGVQVKLIDIVVDVPFMGGHTLNGRCSEYRGLSVEPTTVLNLTQQQFAVSTRPTQPAQPARAPTTAQRSARDNFYTPAQRGAARGASVSVMTRGTSVRGGRGRGDFSGNYQAAARQESSQAYLPVQNPLEAALGIARQPAAQAYNSVPPPAALSHPNGRGGHPARGGAPRGRGHTNGGPQQIINRQAPPVSPARRGRPSGHGHGARGSTRGRSDASQFRSPPASVAS